MSASAASDLPATHGPSVDVRPLIEDIAAAGQRVDLEVVRRAFAFAAERHADQRRRSGEPYLVHPLGVARVIAGLKLDTASLCAGLLHDCVEDTSATPEDIGRQFGQEVQFLVEGVTKLGQIPWSTREEKQAENFRKMLLAMARDIRVILIKLADRLDNMRTLEHMPREKQERIARETRDIYAPLAHRLGIQWLKSELEDLCFRYLEPEEWRALAERMDLDREARDAYVAEVCGRMDEAFRSAGMAVQVEGRAKHLWSIHQRSRRAGREIDQAPDLVSFRVVTASQRDCYAALGVVHTTWTPIPGRFKDYVAIPKPNRYQSLHTTVVGPDADRMEVQIRTDAMNAIAELGVVMMLAKRGDDGSITGAEGLPWLAQLMEWQRDLKDPTEFIESVKIDLFQEEVFVFTPRGDVKALPKGSTPVDFAYAVHSKVGDHCSGARINGHIVPLRYVLRNGDTIEILTSATQRPSKDWLKFVATSKAKARIRARVRAEQRERSRVLGRDLVGRALRRLGGAPLGEPQSDARLAEWAAKMRLAGADDVFVGVGYGKFSPDSVAKALVPGRPAEVEEGVPGSVFVESPSAPARRLPKRSVGGVKVTGDADVVVRFAKCCTPVPGDAIVAFASRARGVLVHKMDCPKALDLDPARRIEVAWDEEARVLRPVEVEVVCADKPGLLASISKSFSEHGVNISQAKCRAMEDSRAVNTFLVAVGHVNQLSEVIRALRQIDGVISAERV